MSTQSTAVPPISGFDGWRLTGAAFGIGLIGVLIVFWPTFAAMETTWRNSDSFQHTYVVPFVIAYLVWENRDRLIGVAPRIEYTGLAVIALASFGWLLGEAANVQVVMQLGAVGVIQGLVLTLFGWRVVRVLWFPLAFLIFLVPIGEFLVPTLQHWTAEFLVWSVHLLGIAIETDSFMIKIADGSQPYHYFHVAKECSGIRYLTAMLQIGLLASYLLFTHWPRRLGAVLLAVVVPIVANWVRALGIVLIVYYTEGRHGRDVDHLIYGFWFFLFVLIVYVGLCWLFADAAPHRRSTVQAGAKKSSSSLALVGAMAAALVAASIGPVYAALTAVGGTTDTLRLSPPAPAVGWRMAAYRGFDWHPEFVGADAEVVSRYARGADTVDLYLGFYVRQRQGAELINSENDLAGVRWQATGTGGSVSVEIDGTSQMLKYATLVGPARQRVVVYGYWVDGRIVTDQRIAKLLAAKARLMGGERASAVLAVAADIDGDIEAALAMVQAFIADTRPFETLEQAVGP